MREKPQCAPLRPPPQLQPPGEGFGFREREREGWMVGVREIGEREKDRERKSERARQSESEREKNRESGGAQSAVLRPPPAAAATW